LEVEKEGMGDEYWCIHTSIVTNKANKPPSVRVRGFEGIIYLVDYSVGNFTSILAATLFHNRVRDGIAPRLKQYRHFVSFDHKFIGFFV
jgi:hypothetical protein